MFKFIFTFGLIVSGLSIGYGIQALVRRKAFNLPLPFLDRLRRFLVKLVLLFINPITIVGAIWTIRMNDGRLVVFPVLEVFAILLGGFLALGAAKILKLERRKTGAIDLANSCWLFSTSLLIVVLPGLYIVTNSL